MRAIQPIYAESRTFFESLLKEDGVRHSLIKLRKHYLEEYIESMNVSLLGADLGRELGFGEESLKILCYGGLLHDIGKLDVSIGILTKTTKPDENEKAELERHPRNGLEYLRHNLEQFAHNGVGQIVVAHHEFQTTPYPRDRNNSHGTAYDGIERRKHNADNDVLVQIVTAADKYVALGNQRAYKRQFSRDEIEKILRDQFTGNPKYIDMVLRRPLVNIN